ncbi:MAG: aminotransferase class V-fold PLP-dependent enzyme [Meiothermus sp.]|uniref:aminotransferase class V-fold PLP-dependent enzyme n=1 Tax=Meiothermus sp. TaxID=1955249 RepID=UPI0028CF812E|nr:aminotransferase class V-fold PLP-dependent enzyme [Meiothermus sp.]MDT7919931.1 aminotransferase class V-fold PLP-dependent enzyme [Meiothermus sp.]
MGYPECMAIVTPQAIRQDFPLLLHHPDLVYLNSAATSQKPEVVIEAVSRYYRELNASVHRGAYTLSVQASEAYERARRTLARFIGADEHEIIFVRNTTEALNLVAYAWGLHNLGPDDEILLTEMEHHANLVPWHLVCERTGAKIKAIPLGPDGRLELEALELKSKFKSMIVDGTPPVPELGDLAALSGVHKLAARVKCATLAWNALEQAAHQAGAVSRAPNA